MLAYEAEGARETLEFLKENMDEKDFYLEEYFFSYFTIHADIRRVGDFVMFENENFKKDVQEIGFKNTMEKYNIKFVVTFNEEPDYIRYANIFSEEELLRPSYRRNDIILSTVRPQEFQYFEDEDVRKKIIEEYNVKDKFVFVKEIGVFRIFGFVN
jgi:hypothetical protein